jgi:hypothetical protein
MLARHRGGDADIAYFAALLPGAKLRPELLDALQIVNLQQVQVIGLQPFKP